MADEPLPPDDPFEAELVAYLDGELDPVAARQVEERLAADPTARARAAALKKTYDLLDYLPQPEPSANFTTRTLDKIPALKSGSLPVPLPSETQLPARPGPDAASSSIPVPLGGGSLGLPPARGRHRWLVAASIVLALGALGGIGYLGSSALRSHLAANSASRDPGLDDLPLSDHRLIEKLPLYAAADDLEFVQRLGDPDLFGDDPAVAVESPPANAAVEPDKLSGPAFEARAKAFKALPLLRQQSIRELDKQLDAVEKEQRDRLFRVLEAYVVWLDRLPDSERRGVLAAATPGLRLDVVHDIRERQWLNALPASLRSQLTGMSDAKKAEKIQQWKDEEARQRQLWMFIRKNAESITGNKAPWPFDTEARRKEVIEFVRAVFHPDEPKRCRLNPSDLATYRDALSAAEKNGGWAWYGKAVYDLTRKHDILPEPADPNLLYQDFKDLPPGLSKYVKWPNIKEKLANDVGRWPDFPLELHRELQRASKFGPVPHPPLGPARVSDFKEPVRTFWEKELSRRLSPFEKGGLQKLENRWPEYPREFVRLARFHDLSVPGVMLPGSPRRWDATYGPGPFRMPGIPMPRP